MPIKGFEREDLDPRFNSLGKLKKGAPKTEGLHDLEWFRFCPKDNNASLLKTFEGAYGPEPTRLEIYLPRPTMEENFTYWRELYGQNELCKVRCNGSDWVDWIEGNAHRHGLKPCDKPYKDTANRCPDCPLKPVGRLEIILPEMWNAGYIGLITIETHSWNDIATIAGKLVQWEPLQGRPFTLWREDTRIGVPIKGKRARVEKSLIKIELTDERLKLLFEQSKQAARAQIEAPTPQVAAGPDWNEIDAEPIDADVIDTVTAENNAPAEEIYAGGETDTDAYEDQHEEQQVGKDIGSIVPRHWGELYEMAAKKYEIKERPHVISIVRKTHPDFAQRGKGQPTITEAWNAFVTYEQSKTQPTEHWSQSEEWWEALRQLKLSPAEATKHLGVEDITDFDGTIEVAIITLSAIVTMAAQ